MTLPWTAYGRQILKRMWLDNESCYAIQVATNRTRKGVLNEAKRQNLSARQIDRARNPQGSTDTSINKQKRRITLQKATVKDLTTPPCEPRKLAEPIRMKVCQFIKGTPDGEDDSKCGLDVIFGTPYCEEHNRITHQ